MKDRLYHWHNKNNNRVVSLINLIINCQTVRFTLGLIRSVFSYVPYGNRLCPCRSDGLFRRCCYIIMNGRPSILIQR